MQQKCQILLLFFLFALLLLELVAFDFADAGRHKSSSSSSEEEGEKRPHRRHKKHHHCRNRDGDEPVPPQVVVIETGRDRDGDEKIADTVRQLSAESAGRRCLKSVHGTFLRAYGDSEWKVDMAPGPVASAWERWYVEDWGGKVVSVFKAIHSPGRFLRAEPDGSVCLVDRPQEWETWKPFKNGNGSWSFLSAHGQWLSARDDGSVRTVDSCRGSWEHFWLESW